MFEEDSGASSAAPVVTPAAQREPEDPQADRYVPILLVGAGPAGLTLANLLGVHGIRALLVERNEATVKEPRAVSIDDESLRTMQAIGLSDVVLETAVPGYGSDYITPGGRCFLTVEPTGRPFGFPRRNAFRQPQLEAQLQAGLRRFSTVQAMYGWALTAFDQGPDGVVAHLTNGHGAQRIIRCEYLVGCDGAGSTVRRRLGLRLEGKTFEQRWLIVDLASSPAPRRNTVVYCNTRRPCIALPGPDQTRRFEFKLHPHERDEDMLRPEVVEGLLRSHGAHPDSVLVRKVVYTFHARVATRWSDGRVLLAGDAAHLTPPFAGQGMNSGLRDCSNLAWKLAMVTMRRMSSTLLETYEQERRAHVQDMIRLALRMGRIMSPRTWLHGFLVQQAFFAIGLWPAAKRFFGEMKYKPKPKFAKGFMQPDGFGRRHTLVGRMLAQPQVRTADRQSVLLDDLLGNGFALVGLEVSVADLCSTLENPAIASLEPACVALNPTSAAGGGATAVATLAAYPPEFERYRGRVLLVRPDRYVAAAGTAGEAGSLASAVQKLKADYRFVPSIASAGPTMEKYDDNAR
ncbi:MAG: bifunctional 3-(3-hydroxy-phenyl)propionate/3-hydroxycinnamic acid hydroxylase [Pseudomonadota bacterium]|nr:bifunctional 3-(3-hydroxy-phenyl)propionate/3-hydroxycinnamic acid hydroxylase [Pseudomonadota bacterium]